MFSDGYPDQFGGPRGKKFKLDRVKNTAQVGQRRQHEGRHDRDIVKLLREDSVDETSQREYDRR